MLGFRRCMHCKRWFFNRSFWRWSSLRHGVPWHCSQKCAEAETDDCARAIGTSANVAPDTEKPSWFATATEEELERDLAERGRRSLAHWAKRNPY